MWLFNRQLYVLCYSTGLVVSSKKQGPFIRYLYAQYLPSIYFDYMVFEVS